MTTLIVVAILVLLSQEGFAIPGAPVQNGVKQVPPFSLAQGHQGFSGSSVAMSADGNTAATGIPYGITGKQGALVYTYSAGVWSLQTTTNALHGTNPSSTAVSQGTSVALSADGNTLASGAPDDNSNAGAIWVFTRSGATWTQDGAKLVELAGAQLGSVVAISDDGLTIASSAPSAAGGGVIFVKSSGGWSQQGGRLTGSDGAGSPQQGKNIALSGDGNTFFSSAQTDNSQKGCVFVFSRSGTVWTQLGSKLTVSGSIQFGSALSVSRDGHFLAVADYHFGASNNSVYVFSFSNGGYSLLRTIVGDNNGATQFFGSAVSLDKFGDRLIVGDRNLDSFIGGFFQFDRSQSVFNQVGTFYQGTGCNNIAGSCAEGAALALSGDGSRMIVGGPNDYYYDGAVWFFDATAATQGPTSMTPSVAPTTSSPVIGSANRSSVGFTVFVSIVGLLMLVVAM